jgi:hypothetical protein
LTTFVFLIYTRARLPHLLLITPEGDIARMIPPDKDFFNTRPSQPLADLQPDWPGLDPSMPYPAPIDSIPPPPPPTPTYPTHEKRLWMRSAPMIIIGILSIAVVLLVIALFSLQHGVIGVLFSATSNRTSSSSTNVQSIITSNSHGTPTSQPNAQGTTTLSTKAAPSPTPITTTTSTASTPTATTTVSPSLTVTFTCSTVSGGKGTPGPQNLAHICVQTSAGAHLTIAALHCDGHPDGNLRQTTGTADDLGDFQWTWAMQDPGPCQQEFITVTAKLSSGATGQNSVYLPFSH